MHSSWKTHRLRTQKRSILLSTEKGASKVLIENHRSAVLSCEFHKSGQYLVSSNSGGQIHICATDSASEKLAFLKGHKEDVTEVHYSSDGVSIYSVSLDRTIGVWDAFRGVRMGVIIGHSNRVNTVQSLRSGRPVICSGSSDKTVRVWDIRQRDCGAMFKTQHEVSATCFSGCGRYIFSGGLDDGDISAWDVRQKDVVHILAGHTDAVTGLSLSPSRRNLASCSVDGTLRTWDVTSPAEAKRELKSFPLLQGELNHLRRCAWSPDGRLVAGGSGKRVIILDACSGERLYEMDGHKEAVLDVAFHPKRKILASAGADKNLVLHYM